jgi:hypothetical protein
VTDLRAGFFSLTSGAVDGDDAGYLQWHLLDHLPEQYTLFGIRLGTRWRADDACVALRLAAEDGLDAARHAVCYLITDPVADTLTAFGRLGRQLAEAGRYPVAASPLLLGAFELVDARAASTAVVSAAAIPFRPHRGVYLLVERVADPSAIDAWWQWHREEHLPRLLGVEGVAGVYAFRASAALGEGADQGARLGVTAPWDPGHRQVAVVYLDDDIAATASRLAPLITTRWADGTVSPRLAGPFRSPVTYEAWPAQS